VISYLASNGLTFPLRLITQKIRKTTLSGYNEPLSWNTDDEIGLMVSEYNKMLINLEESKKALAATEKESAWREMAQQVAHEIKNPLTPMKLNLQHIKRRIEAGEEGDQAQRERQINSLLEQVNTLSDIATSFSAFAKMPAPQSERFEMIKLLREVIALYNKQESGEIVADLEDREFIIDGDRQWISRAVSNIIINGFQAARQRDNPTVTIKCHGHGQNLLRLEIMDNGEGIPQNIRDKVFLPNFSTKFTGSGIGLAMAKRAIEHAGGKIWFETEEGAGTVFFIELHTS
jgi:nitrogen fixation/metabolism regulation signal transduction histidine kinase